MTKHTPGPWTPSWNDDRSWIGVDCGNSDDPHLAEVCTISYESAQIAQKDDDAWNQCLADARLIAAAPDLLEALKKIRDERDYLAEHGIYSPNGPAAPDCFDDWAADIADTAIAKATGQ